MGAIAGLGDCERWVPEELRMAAPANDILCSEYMHESICMSL
jgi:hypothetical protein